MDRRRAAGLALTVVSILGYVAGILVPYPGRAASVTGMMVGITLLAIGRAGRGDEGMETQARPVEDRDRAADQDRPSEDGDRAVERTERSAGAGP